MLDSPLHPAALRYSASDFDVPDAGLGAFVVNVAVLLLLEGFDAGAFAHVGPDTAIAFFAFVISVDALTDNFAILFAASEFV